MARLLILNNEYPADLTHGQHLRIHALCRELLRTHDCYFISFSEKGSESSGHEDLHFTEEVYLSPPEKKNRSLMRHFRLSSARYLEQSSPDYFRRTVAEVRKLASQWDVEVLVNFSPRFGEIGKEIDLPRILDYPDSGTLSFERALAHRGREMDMKNRLLSKLQLARQSARDRELLGKYDLVTTIAEPDRKRMLEVSGLTRDRVIVIPNGVGADFLQQSKEAAQSYSGATWISHRIGARSGTSTRTFSFRSLLKRAFSGISSEKSRKAVWARLLHTRWYTWPGFNQTSCHTLRIRAS